MISLRTTSKKFMAHRDQNNQHLHIQQFLENDPNNLEDFIARNPIWRRLLLRRTALLTAKAWFEQGVQNNNTEIDINSALWTLLVNSLEAVILARDPELQLVDVELNYNIPT